MAYQSDQELMIQAAWMYYRDGLTQKAIAHKLGVPRVTVTRLLQQARIIR